MRVLVTGILLAGCGYLCAPASAARHDAAATRAYLQAAETSTQTEYSALGTTVATIETTVALVNQQCPLSLTYAPRDSAFEEVTHEATATLFDSARRSLRPLLLRLAGAIAHLQWPDRVLTTLVHERAIEERSIAGLALPDLCNDIARWKATAYASLPASVGRFASRSEAVEATATVGPREEPRERVILRMLRRSENSAQRHVAARIERLEGRLEDRVSAAFMAARRKLAAALGVAAL